MQQTNTVIYRLRMIEVGWYWEDVN